MTSIDAQNPAIAGATVKNRIPGVTSESSTGLVPKSYSSPDLQASDWPAPAAVPTTEPNAPQMVGPIPGPSAAPATDTPVTADTTNPLPGPWPAPADPSVAPAETPSVATTATPYMHQSADGKYSVVKVFYGTDRAAVEDAEAKSGNSRQFFYGLTAASALVTIGLALAGFRLPRMRMLFPLSFGGLVLTVVLGVTSASGGLPIRGVEQAVRQYGPERGRLEMGTCEVSLPLEHQVGELESPSVFKLEFSQDPERHVVLMGVKMEEPDTFYRELRNCVGQCNRKEAFVFVHGYNVSFEEAARRTAQIAYDLKFEGAPIFYSWPSQGGLLGYTVDETNVVWTVPHLKEFLVGVAERSGAESVHVVAHSMGNRAVTSALRELAYEIPDKHPMFKEVVLTAPDVDADVFRRDLAPAIVKTAKRVTLYASSNDEALVVSKQVHGYPRAGESGDQLIVIPGIDTIDVSEIDTSLIGHSYYGSNDTVLADIYDVMHSENPPDLRKSLRAMQLGQLKYWMFLR